MSTPKIKGRKTVLRERPGKCGVCVKVKRELRVSVRIVPARGRKLSMRPSLVVVGLYIVHSRILRENEKGV